MNSEQRLSYLHLMNKAAESEDRQSYFYYLKLAEQTLNARILRCSGSLQVDSANHVGLEKAESKAKG